MSTGTTTHPVRPIALATTSPDPAEAARVAAYHARVDVLRRVYRRRARHNGLAANGVTVVLVTIGAFVGLSSTFSTAEFVSTSAAQVMTAVLGFVVMALEGVTRALKPALRAHRARWVVRRLDREVRLFDARGRGYRGSDEDAEEDFVDAVERILARADAAEEHDETGTTSGSSSRRSA